MFSMIFYVQICYRNCICKIILTPPPPQTCINWARCRSDNDCGKSGECKFVTDIDSHCLCKQIPKPIQACIQGAKCRMDDDCGSGECRIDTIIR